MHAEFKDCSVLLHICLSQIVNTELFKCLREKHGALFESFISSKLVPVAGNMREMNIGIEEHVANLIAGEVDMIINSAATTTFDQRYIARPPFDTFNLLCIRAR